MFRVLRYTDSREYTDGTVNGQSSSRFTQQGIGDGGSWELHRGAGYGAGTAGRNSIYCDFVSSLNPLSPISADSLLPSSGSIGCSPVGFSVLGLNFLVFALTVFFKIMRASPLGRWPKVWLLLALIGLAIFATDCNSSPIAGSEANRLEKRATQVSLIGYTYTNRVLAGTISVSFQ